MIIVMQINPLAAVLIGAIVVALEGGMCMGGLHDRMRRPIDSHWAYYTRYCRRGGVTAGKGVCVRV